MRLRVLALAASAAAIVLVILSASADRATSAAAPVAVPTAVPPSGLATAVFDPERLASPASATHLNRIRASGATLVRISLSWPSIAPKGESVPVGFDAADPADPGYSWASVDRQVKLATARGLAPIAMIGGAPLWAQTGKDTSAPSGVSAAAYGRFALAAARRYAGTFEDLPRIRFWQAWNEPNISTFLRPQLAGGKPLAAWNYRALVNGFAGGVKSVHRDNLVIAGGLAPFRDSTEEVVRQDSNWGPLSFMREVLCLDSKLRSKCGARVKFDIWSIHPYTSGGPTRHAVRPNDVSLGDLPELRKTLDAARRAKHIVGSAPTRLWVTEFSWDSAPPDPKAVPMALLSRWVAHALYVMWQNGVSLVTWFSVADYTMQESYFQSGLYFGSGRAKPIRQAFRFPVVALPHHAGTLVWGRTPSGVRQRVIIERSASPEHPWRRIATLQAGSNGLFRRAFDVRATGRIRARIVGTGERSVPFAAEPVPDQFFNPFGSTTLLESG